MKKASETIEKGLPKTTKLKVKIGSQTFSHGKITNETTSNKEVFRALARAVKNGSFATQE